MARVGVHDVLLRAEREAAGRCRERPRRVEHAPPARGVDDEAGAQRARRRPAARCRVGARGRRPQQRHVRLRGDDAAQRRVVERAERLGQVEAVAAPADLHPELVVLLADRLLGAEEAQRPHGRGAGGGLALAERAAVDQHRVGAGELPRDGEAGEGRADDDAAVLGVRRGGHGDESYGPDPPAGAVACATRRAQRVRVLRPGGRVHHELQVGCLERREGRPLQPQPAHHGVLERPRAGLGHGHLVPRPQGAEGLGRLGHLVHAGAHRGVAGVQVERRTGLRDEVGALRLQVEQQARQVLVDEQQVQQVAVLGRHRLERREEGRLRRVPGEHVERRPHQHRRPGQERVEQALQPRADRRRHGGARRGGVAGEVHRVGALRRRQPQRSGQRLQHLAGRPRGAALLDQRQPGGADAGHRGDLLAPQPACAAAAGRLEAERLRGDALAAGPQQVAEGAAAEGVVHSRAC